jgi:hypothetical protein
MRYSVVWLVTPCVRVIKLQQSVVKLYLHYQFPYYGNIIFLTPRYHVQLVDIVTHSQLTFIAQAARR